MFVYGINSVCNKDTHILTYSIQTHTGSFLLIRPCSHSNTHSHTSIFSPSMPSSSFLLMNTGTLHFSRSSLPERMLGFLVNLFFTASKLPKLLLFSFFNMRQTINIKPGTVGSNNSGSKSNSAESENRWWLQWLRFGEYSVNTNRHDVKTYKTITPEFSFYSKNNIVFQIRFLPPNVKIKNERK